MKRVLVAAAAAILISSSIFGAETDEQKIRARADEFAAAWNKHDPMAMAYIWSVDGDVINPMGRRASGLTEIQKLFSDEHGPNGMMKATTFATTGLKIRFLQPDLALVDIDSEITGMTGPDGAPMTMKPHLVSVMRKSGGQWWISAARAIAYMQPPPPPAAK